MDNQKVIVLLSTYNGEKYLEEQLESLIAQAGVDVDILVRDDGSTDKTHEILARWHERGFLKWYLGENLRPAKSFMNLIENAPEAEYYAFCDQDDVWKNDKLIVAITRLKKDKADLYFSAYTTADSELNILKSNIQKPIMHTLGQAMVYASVTGCTMVFRRKLLNYAKMYRPLRLMMHDSWIYKVALATDCIIVYDEQSHILYRQHGDNVIGNNTNIIERWKKRVGRIISSTRSRYDECYDLYCGYKDIMKEPLLCQLRPIIDYYHKSLWQRMKIAKNNVYCTGVKSKDCLFKIAILLKRF